MFLLVWLCTVLADGLTVAFAGWGPYSKLAEGVHMSHMGLKRGLLATAGEGGVSLTTLWEQSSLDLA